MKRSQRLTLVTGDQEEMTVTIDFSGHQELFRTIRDEAAMQMRTMDNYLMFFVANALKSKIKKKGGSSHGRSKANKEKPADMENRQDEISDTGDDAA